MKHCEPNSLDEFVGQTEAKQVLRVLCKSARKRGDAVSHMLLCGPPGLGKTTLARLVAREMGTRLIELLGPSIQSPDELTSILVDATERDTPFTLFIDEIHSMQRSSEEQLYPLIDSNEMIVADSGFNNLVASIGLDSDLKCSRKVNIGSFTLIGATTLPGSLSGPLRSRFAHTLTMKPYSTEELACMVCEAAKKLDFRLDSEPALEIARRSRESARVALRNLEWVWELCVSDDATPDLPTIEKAFGLRGIDEHGLGDSERRYLATLVGAHGPVGLGLMATKLNESEDTLRSTIEPFLLRGGYISHGPRGRVAEPKAVEVIRNGASS